MSRSGYNEDSDDNWAIIRYAGMVASATRGKRGQAMFREMLIGMNGMIVKRLISEDLETASGEVCAIGVVGKLRGIDMAKIDPEDPETVGAIFNVADCLARDIVYANDDCGRSGETPERRFIRMRKWLRRRIKDPLFDVVWC